MCACGGSWKLGAMNERIVSVGLELRVVGDSLIGRAWSGMGAQREFYGWLGLVAAIDALVADSNGASQEG
jgi:hypothetical protein